jgi:hypothetical protein
VTKVYLFYSDGFELKNRVNILILKPFVGLYRGVAATMVFVSRVSGLSRNEDVVVEAWDWRRDAILAGNELPDSGCEIKGNVNRKGKNI